MEIKNNQQGVSTILFTIMILGTLSILAFSSSAIIVSNLKISRNFSDSTQAYYAAESGLEEAFYETNKGQYQDKSKAPLGSIKNTEYKYSASSDLPEYIPPGEPLQVESKPRAPGDPAGFKTIDIAYKQGSPDTSATVEVTIILINGYGLQSLSGTSSQNAVKKYVCKPSDLKTKCTVSFSGFDQIRLVDQYNFKQIIRIKVVPSTSSYKRTLLDMSLLRADGTQETFSEYSRITATGNTGDSHRSVSASLRSKATPFAIFDYTIFSNEKLIK